MDSTLERFNYGYAHLRRKLNGTRVDIISALYPASNHIHTDLQ